MLGTIYVKASAGLFYWGVSEWRGPDWNILTVDATTRDMFSRLAEIYGQETEISYNPWKQRCIYSDLYIFVDKRVLMRPRKLPQTHFITSLIHTYQPLDRIGNSHWVTGLSLITKVRKIKIPSGLGRERRRISIFN